MKTILIDNDRYGLTDFALACERIQDVDLVGSFTSPIEALKYAKHNVVECALLDVEMPEMNGFELYDTLKKLYPQMIVILVTAHEKYTVQAIKKK